MSMNINWYPGHMKKTLDEIKSKQKLVDFVIEIIDSRIPISSRNPLFDSIISKKRLVILNKSDLSDPRQNALWVDKINCNNERAILYNSLKNNRDLIVKESKSLMEEIIKNKEEKGINHGLLRAMIVGIPNSGKSTFINNVSGKKSAKTGNKPGITKTNQWIKINPELQLLDTPGILWPKFTEETSIHLAWTGAIKDEIIDIETLAYKFIENILSYKPEILIERYNIDLDEDPLKVMDNIAKKRGAIMKGNEIDYTKVSNIILDEFRKGVLGRISLERL